MAYVGLVCLRLSLYVGMTRTLCGSAGQELFFMTKEMSRPEPRPIAWLGKRRQVAGGAARDRTGACGRYHEAPPHLVYQTFRVQRARASGSRENEARINVGVVRGQGQAGEVCGRLFLRWLLAEAGRHLGEALDAANLGDTRCSLPGRDTHESRDPLTQRKR